jgi:PAS domain S-box-containing protein
MSGANPPQYSNSSVIDTTFQPAFIVRTSEEKASLHILHVDDDVSLLEVSKQILSMENNFEIDTAPSVDEAFKKMESQCYDTVISDYEMPLKNGLDFLKELREAKKEIPFILFTGKGREDVAVKALNLGADSYINKNGSPETVYCELADAINKTVERKKSKQLLAESEMKYRTLVEKSLQGVLITRTSPLQLVFANESMGNILGYSTDELKCLSPIGVAGLVYDEDKDVFFSRLESRMRGEPADSSLEFRAVRKNGSIIWLEAFANRIEYMGKPAVQGMFLDITERKKAGEILRESEERYRELANSLPDIVYESDTAGKLVFVNERAPEISGYSKQELEKGISILEFLAPEDRERAMKNIQRLLAGGNYVPAEYTFLRKDGTTFPALITTTRRISKNKVTGLRGLVLDITERKKADEVVRKSEARYRELANFLPEIVFEADLSGKITFFNEQAFAMTGITREELRKGLDILQFVVPEERERAMENIKSRMTGKGLGANEYTLMRKNGTTFPALVKTATIISGNKVIGLRGLVMDITERKKTEQEFLDLAKFPSENPYPVLRVSKNGQILYANEASNSMLKGLNVEIGQPPPNFLTQPIAAALDSGLKQHVECELNQRTFFFTIAPVKDAAYTNVYGLDITERKKAEEALNRTMDELVAVNEKLNVASSLTRHDVRNKLLAVNGNAFLLKKKHPEQADVIEGLGEMEQACKVIGAILDFAKIYEQTEVKELTYTDAEKAFDEALALFPGSLTVKVVNDCRGLTLLADSFLRQMFFNLIDNSAKHGKKVTAIKVSYEKRDRDRLNLIYEDDGIGIPFHSKPQLFKIGFSTGGSSGIGLYLIRKMMEVYGWAIQEDGEPDKGAKFTITIPKINNKGKENFRIA